MKGTLASPAVALASRVLPVPGGPVQGDGGVREGEWGVWELRTSSQSNKATSQSVSHPTIQSSISQSSSQSPNHPVNQSASQPASHPISQPHIHLISQSPTQSINQVLTRQNSPFRNLGPQFSVLVRILEEINKLHDFYLGFLTACHVPAKRWGEKLGEKAGCREAEGMSKELNQYLLKPS